MGISIIGGGNIGLALAGHLQSMGESVCVWNRTVPPRSIELHGALTFSGTPQLTTTSIGEAMRFSELLVVATPASAHASIATLIVRDIKPHHFVLLCPGRVFGAIRFHETLKRLGAEMPAAIAETQTVPYAARRDRAFPGRVLVSGLKAAVPVASIPRSRLTQVVSRFPPEIGAVFVPVANVLETSLNNVGMLLHAAPMLLNIARLEDTRETFDYYSHGITESVAKIIDSLDRERKGVCDALKVPFTSLKDWLSQAYGTDTGTTIEVLRSIEPYRGLKTPTSLDHRYVSEDGPFALYQTLTLATECGVSCPTMTAVATLLQIMTGAAWRDTAPPLDLTTILELSRK